MAFGGIIGLFLGCSLLSLVEVVYYFTLGLYHYQRKAMAKSVKKNGKLAVGGQKTKEMKRNEISLGHL